VQTIVAFLFLIILHNFNLAQIYKKGGWPKLAWKQTYQIYLWHDEKMECTVALIKFTGLFVNSRNQILIKDRRFETIS